MRSEKSGLESLWPDRRFAHDLASSRAVSAANNSVDFRTRTAAAGAAGRGTRDDILVRCSRCTLWQIGRRCQAGAGQHQCRNDPSHIGTARSLGLICRGAARWRFLRQAVAAARARSVLAVVGPAARAVRPARFSTRGPRPASGAERNSYSDIDPHPAAKQTFRKDRDDRHNCLSLQAKQARTIARTAPAGPRPHERSNRHGRQNRSTRRPQASGPGCHFPPGQGRIKQGAVAARPSCRRKVLPGVRDATNWPAPISRCLRPVVRDAARAYIAGEQLSDALAVRKRLATDGLAATLGYWDSERDQPEGTAALYIEALAALAGSGDYLSIKLPVLAVLVVGHRPGGRSSPGPRHSPALRFACHRRHPGHARPRRRNAGCRNPDERHAARSLAVQRGRCCLWR